MKTEITFVESLEIAISENHGAVSGSVNVIDLTGVIEHNKAVYEHFETLSERQIITHLENQEGRLYAWWRTGVITDDQHNNMLKEARMQAMKAFKAQSSTDLYREQATLEKGIKFFVADCPACTELFKLPTGQYDNVLCQSCNASGVMDSIDLESAVSGIGNELKLFAEWYKAKNNENPNKYPIEHLGVNALWRKMFVEFMYSDIKEQFKLSKLD
ncbi:hypothetical protein ACFJ47_003415 [Vibrio cholerae]